MLLSQHEDKSFKVLIDSAMDEFLKGLGIGEDILISLPTDLITTSCVNRRMDYCALSKKYEIINVEFQSTALTKQDEIRIFDYASSLFVKYKRPVKTFIISTVEDKSRKIEKWHHNDVFTIYVISLKDKEALEGINRIKSKIKNKETFKGEDFVSLISIIFMKSNLTEKDLIFIVADLTNKAKFESDFVKDQVKSILLVLGDKFIKEHDELKQLGEILMMDSSHLLSFVKRTNRHLIEEGIIKGKYLGIGEGFEIGKKEGIKEGIKEGKKEGREEGSEERAVSVAKWMLEKGMSIEDIQEATGLSMEKINSLKEKMKVE